MAGTRNLRIVRKGNSFDCVVSDLDTGEVLNNVYGIDFNVSRAGMPTVVVASSAAVEYEGPVKYIKVKQGDEHRVVDEQVWPEPIRELESQVHELRNDVKEFRQALYSFMMEYTEPE